MVRRNANQPQPPLVVCRLERLRKACALLTLCSLRSILSSLANFEQDTCHLLDPTGSLMTFLMVDLNDTTDCQRAVQQLRRHLQDTNPEHGSAGRNVNQGCGPRGRGKRNQSDGKTPLRQKLARVRQRGVWRFMVQIAELDNQARSLPELDEALGLPRNKMRSTKAIFAKLENRLDVRFLRVDEDAGEDASGNPRYMMPPRIRKLILSLSNESDN